MGFLVRVLLTFIVMLSMLLSEVSYAEQYSPQGIRVSGQAKVAQPISQFSLSFDITELGFSATKTKIIVDAKSDQVISALKSFNIPDKSINSAKLRLTTIEDKNEINRLFAKQDFQSKQRKGQVLTVVETKKHVNKADRVLFRVTRTIEVKFAQIGIYDRLLDKLVKVGVTRLAPLSTSGDKSELYYQKALDQAIKNAKQKALQIASQAGVKLGKLIYLEELSYHMPQADSMAMSSRSFHQSYQGQKSVNAQVNVIFAIDE